VVFSGVLLPFAAGFVLAYLFQPLARRLCRAGVPRGAAAFLVVSALIVALAVIFALILPPLIDQLGQLVRELPRLYQRARAWLVQHYGHFLHELDQPHQPGAPGPVEQEIRQQVTPWLVSELQGLLKSSLDLFNSLALLFLTPVITFFLLRDWDKMTGSIRKFLLREHAAVMLELAREIDLAIAGYLRGTFIVLLIVSGFYMASLGIIGLDYGLLIGLGAGLFSFVPYLGSIGGFLVSGGVAAHQFWPDYTMIALVCGVFVLGQLVEGNLLTPNIVGKSIQLHPVWLLFALVASGYLLGFLGLLISVPLAATAGVLVRFAIRKHYEIPMHSDAAGREAGSTHIMQG
jgi:predicted PurR-regulated permease PerM